MSVPYGVMNPLDCFLLDKCLDHLKMTVQGPINVIEVGIHRGDTSRGIRDRLGARLGVFVGIDNGIDHVRWPAMPDLVAPFPGARLVIGDSETVFVRLRDTPAPHFVLIDGCHCRNHVILDFHNYGARAAPMGLVGFHDVNPDFQGGEQHAHSSDAPEFKVAVRDALEKIGLLNGWLRGWELWGDSLGHPGMGGLYVYRRLE